MLYEVITNATLLVVGDIKAESLLPTIKQLFEPIPRGPEPKPVMTMEAEQKGERRFLLKREAQVPFVMMGYRVPNYTVITSYSIHYTKLYEDMPDSDQQFASDGHNSFRAAQTRF